MDLSYAIPFGKLSQTVKRHEDDDDLLTTLSTPGPSTPANINSNINKIYPDSVLTYIGHASRKDLTDNVEYNVKEILMQKRRRETESFDINSLVRPMPHDHLPHPSKLWKTSKKVPAMKPVKSQFYENNMSVNHHLNKLKQKNQKHQLCMESNLPTSNTVPQNEQPVLELTLNHATLFSDGSHTIVSSNKEPVSVNRSRWDSFLPTQYLPSPDRSTPIQRYMKAKPSYPGSSSVSSTLDPVEEETSSLEQEEEEKWFHQQQEEEEKWFRQLWKPRKRKYTEE